MATNFLMFCSTGITDGVAFVVGVLGVDCAAGVICAAGRVYNGFGEDAVGSGLFLGWALALGSKFMGIG